MEVFFGKLEVFFWEVKCGFSLFKVAVLEAHTVDSQAWRTNVLGLGGGFSFPPMPFASVGTSRSGVMKRWLQGTLPHPMSTPQHHPCWLVDWQAWKTNYVGLGREFASSSSHSLLHLNLHLKFGSCEARIGCKLPCPISIPQHYPCILTISSHIIKLPALSLLVS